MVELFVENYSKILNDGTYDNPEKGLFDINGYYYDNENNFEDILNNLGLSMSYTINIWVCNYKNVLKEDTNL